MQCSRRTTIPFGSRDHERQHHTYWHITPTWSCNSAVTVLKSRSIEDMNMLNPFTGSFKWNTTQVTMKLKNVYEFVEKLDKVNQIINQSSKLTWRLEHWPISTGMVPFKVQFAIVRELRAASLEMPVAMNPGICTEVKFRTVTRDSPCHSPHPTPHHPQG